MHKAGPLDLRSTFIVLAVRCLDLEIQKFCMYFSSSLLKLFEFESDIFGCGHLSLVTGMVAFK